MVYRHAYSAYPPLSGDGARRNGGRWNPKDSFPVVYTALDIATADAEVSRSSRRAAIDSGWLPPRRLATIRVRLSRVLDLTNVEERRSLGISEADITADDIGLPNEIGQAAHHLGFEGVLAPSATGQGTVLAIFLDSRAADSIVEIAQLAEGHVVSPGQAP